MVVGAEMDLIRQQVHRAAALTETVGTHRYRVVTLATFFLSTPSPLVEADNQGVEGSMTMAGLRRGPVTEAVAVVVALS